MAKKRKKRERTDNKNNNQSNKNCKSKKSTKKNSDKSSSENKRLSDFSYAELIVLSATLSYSLAEELDEEDLAIFLVFLGLLLAEMQTIVTQRAIKARSQAAENEDVDLAEDDIDLDLGL